jgi:hypothetical protein
MELSGTWCLRRTADANLKRQQAESVVGVPTMVLSETFWPKARPYSFFGLSEGACGLRIKNGGGGGS